MKRVAFDARYINDRYHGIGRYAFNLLDALTVLAPQYQFIVYKGNWVDRRFDWQVLEARSNTEIRTGPWPLYWPQEQFMWLKVLKKARIDLFHTPYFSAPLLAHLPRLITVHDLIFDRYPQYMPWRWLYSYYRFLMARNTKVAQHIVTVSQATANDLNYFYHTPIEKITVIPEGVDQHFRQEPSQLDQKSIRWRYGLNRPFILTVGARRPHKNLGRLVEAFAKLASQFPHDLVIAGSHDARFPDQAREAAVSLSLDGRVRFIEWIPEPDLPRLYAIADLLVLPSLVEGFGLPALEAMACGTPVVATKTASFPEVVGDAGVLVDPHDTTQLTDAIHGLLQDEYRREQLSKAGINRAATFRWEGTAAKTLNLYAEILG